jgi:hypothetical protein
MRARVVAFALAVALGLGACGGDDDDAGATGGATTPATEAPVDTTDAPAGATTTVPPDAGADPGQAHATVIADHLDTVHGRTDITGVHVDGDTAHVLTTVAPGEAATGVEICEHAAMVAYASGVAVLSIVDRDDGVLATGEAGGTCAAG